MYDAIYSNQPCGWSIYFPTVLKTPRKGLESSRGSGRTCLLRRRTENSRHRVQQTTTENAAAATAIILFLTAEKCHKVSMHPSHVQQKRTAEMSHPSRVSFLRFLQIIKNGVAQIDSMIYLLYQVCTNECTAECVPISYYCMYVMCPQIRVEYFACKNNSSTRVLV